MRLGALLKTSMIEEIKRYPQFIKLITSDFHLSIEDIESISLFRDAFRYVDEKGMWAYIPLDDVEFMICFKDGSRRFASLEADFF